ncbi:MAG: hypothetical protein PVF15_10655 [Candidatus Bathyarchaeota archaeon]|jgi:hypothetical protein
MRKANSQQEVRAILSLFDGEINLYEKETERGLEKAPQNQENDETKYLDSELLLSKEKLQR